MTRELAINTNAVMPPIESVSVLIPTRDRANKLATCLSHLARQTFVGASGGVLVPAVEVIVSLDGPDDASRKVCERALAAWPKLAVRVVEGPRDGYMVARNRALSAVRGGLSKDRLIISINDDVRPEPGFIEAHVRAHMEAQARGIRLCVVTGSSPWVVHEPDRLFDRLIRETSMVFFYDAMDAAVAKDGDGSRWRDWGFRHAWGLNTSIPAWAIAEVGPYAEYAGQYGYEDVEMVHRVCERFGVNEAGKPRMNGIVANLGAGGAVPVLYRQEAFAPHDHRMEPKDYIAREYKLGYTAWSFSRVSARCAQAIFTRDIAGDGKGELAKALAHVAEELPRAKAAAKVLMESAKLDAKTGIGTQSDAFVGAFTVEAAYQAHIPAKRCAWHLGLADAIRGYGNYADRAVAELEVE